VGYWSKAAPKLKLAPPNERERICSWGLLWRKTIVWWRSRPKTDYRPFMQSTFWRWA